MISERDQSWIDDARVDLEAARLLAENRYPHLAIFCARQSLEKLLKWGYPITQEGDERGVRVTIDV